jgi:glycosyltransferase involved in cell wall biosynthesis
VKILLIHNFYQIVGGEDTVMQSESDLLINNGNELVFHVVDNAQIGSLFSKILAMLNVSFSYPQYRKMLKILKTENPDVVHVHNYFPLLSPSIFYACKKVGVPSVHTLHNYRAVCPTALLMHDGKINEASLKGNAWWTVTKRVYRDSLIGSFTLACMVELHKFLGTWQTKVDRFIALTEFSKQKYIEAGWPAQKICVKPNFIEDRFNDVKVPRKQGGYSLFVGRLSEEKGVGILFDSWQGVGGKLKIIGDGPLKDFVEKKSTGSVQFLGRKDKEDVLKLVRNADFIIMPSTWYETFGMVIIEAFSCGTPVLVSRLGSLQTIVKDGITGLHFEAGNSQDLAEKAQWLIDHPECAREMGQNARNEYLLKYTPEKNYEMLIDIYQQAIEEAKKN